MHALIVDDEKRARESILQIINLYCPEITTIKEANSVSVAIEAIRQQKPDILFLDIRLGNRSGFDVLEETAEKELNTIFITAYDEYAIKAFKVSAIDYLLKPVDPDDFLEAVQKVQQKLNQNLFSERMSLLLQNMEGTIFTSKKITLKTTDTVHIINVADIIYCEADRNYTTFHLMNDQKVIVSKTLGEYETLLPKQKFMRTHQSYLANLDHIIRYEKGDKNALITIKGQRIPIANRKKELVSHFLKNLS